jgi:DNA-binding NarL/FixJ family response regulator
MIPIRILIAEDYLLLRELWSITLNEDRRFQVVAACEDGDEAVLLFKSLRPDIVLMDISLVRVSGVEATTEIISIQPSAKIIGLTAFALPRYAKQLLQAGARGYVTKNSPKEELFEAIIQVYQGNKYICREIKDAISSEMFADKSENSIDMLSQRESQIILLIKEGMLSREIALHLNLSMNTVEVHRHNILKKLNLRNSAALVNFVNTREYVNYK